MRIRELRDQRANRIAEMRGLVETAEREKRDLGETERQRFDTLKGEVAGIETRIDQAETLESFERYGAAESVGGHGGAAELEARYQVGKALEEFSRTGQLTGAEREYASERRSGRGNAFAAPVSAFLGGERRYIGTTQPAAGPGGNLVATSLGPLINRPRPRLAVQALGATTLSGLTDNLDLPRLKSSGAAGWVPEHGPVTGSDPTFDKVSMGPKTVTARYEMSRRMMIQAPQLEQVLRYDIGWLLAQQLDLAATMSVGANNSPRGIKGTPGVHKVAGGYADPVHLTVSEVDNVVCTMMALVESADIGGSTGFLAHPAVKATINRFRGTSGELLGVDSIFKGEPVAWSTQIPANAGTTTNLATILYGNWPDLIIGYWSNVDILLNPYASEMADRGGARLHAFLDADVAVRHPESFVFSEDFPTTQNATSTVVAA